MNLVANYVFSYPLEMVSTYIKLMEPDIVITINNDSDNDNFITKFKLSIVKILLHDSSLWLVCLICYNIFIVSYFCFWVYSTNSLALAAYTNTLFFNLSALIVCLITTWVEQTTVQNIRSDLALTENINVHQKVKHENTSGPLHCASFASTAPRQSSISVLGLERYELLCLALYSLATLFIAFSISALGLSKVDHFAKHIDLFYILIGVTTYFITVMTYPKAELVGIIRFLLPFPIIQDINLIFTYNVLTVSILCFFYFSQYFWNSSIIDIAAAHCLVCLTAAFMISLIFFAGRIVFQNFASYISQQLDLCLREALHLDGVIEIRNEKFWTVSFGNYVGSLDVRIRENADEDYVLQNVIKHVSRVVKTLSVNRHCDKQRKRHAECYPVEYYIDEILSGESSLDVKKSDCANETKAVPSSILNIKGLIERQTSGKKLAQEPLQNVFVRPRPNNELQNYLFRAD